MTTSLWSQSAETVTGSGAGNAGTIGLHFTVSAALGGGKLRAAALCS
jgi:hypothetical protein